MTSAGYSGRPLPLGHVQVSDTWTRPEATAAGRRKLGAMLDERTVDPDPLRQFEAWFEEARAAGVVFPETTALATASADGSPSARMVLLKGADGRGLVFFTNTGSRKGAELDENPRAALVLYWRELGRQVRVEGR